MSTSSAGESRLHPMPAIDGLRALAVTAVFAYHAGVPWTSGGFLGVDVFFVISGYLITALLLADWRRMKRLAVGRFWWRRAKRLLPALLVVLAATVAAVWLLAGDQSHRLRGDLWAAITYVTNWHLIFQHQSYFEATGRPPLLQHLWTLAVEAQFYVVWPLVLAVALRFRRKAAQLAPWVAAGALASAVLMALLYDPVGDPSRVYFGTDTRLSAILIGAALACVWPPGSSKARVPVRGRVVLDLAGVAAIFGLAWCIRGFDEFDTFLYRGGFAGVAVLAAIAVAVAARPGKSFTARALASRPLVWLGVRSYSVYLWYWPVLMLTRPHSDIALTGTPLLALRAAITLALATASYRWVECPVRQGALGQIWADFRTRLRSARSVRRSPATVAMACGTAVVALAAGTAIGRPAAPAHQVASPAGAGFSQSLAFTQTAGFLGARSGITSTTSRPAASPTSGDPAVAPEAALAGAGYASAAAVPVAAPVAAPGVTPVATLEATPVATPVAVPTAVPVTEPPPLRVVAIGDSVLESARSALQQRLPGSPIDATMGRQFGDIVEIIRRLRDAGQLSERMVIHAGNNGIVRASQFDEMMDLLREVDRVVVVNVRVPRAWETPNNEVFAKAVERWPNLVVADWHAAASQDLEGVFERDATHLKPKGASRYADVVVSAL